MCVWVVTLFLSLFKKKRGHLAPNVHAPCPTRSLLHALPAHVTPAIALSSAAHGGRVIEHLTNACI